MKYVRKLINRKTVVVGFLLLIAGTGNRHLFAMPWSLDMYDQRHIKPQEAIRKYPDQTVSQNTPDRSLRIKKIAKKLRNFRSPSQDSILRGKKLYQIICVVCHGNNGMGKTRVSKKFKDIIVEPLDIESLYDGEIYVFIRFGHIRMPPYAANMTTDEIWDIVNYLRILEVPVEFD